MKNYLIYVITAFGLSILLVFVLVLPVYSSLSDLNAQIFEKEASLQFQQEYFDELIDVSEKIEEQEESFEKINSAIPKGGDLANLMNYFQRSASKAGVSMESVSPALIASTQQKKIHASRVNLIISGGYSAFKSFLAIVEKSSRLIEIEDVSFQSPSEEGDPFNFNVSTRVYYY